MKFALHRHTGHVLWALPDGRFCDLTRALGSLAPRSLLAALCDFNLHAHLQWLPLREDYCVPATTELACPLPNPNRILAIGRNYSEHAAELGNHVPDEPVVFQKANSCIIGPLDAICIPDDLGRTDHEAELLVVIGKDGHKIQLEDAMAYVAGYSIINDVTARAKSKELQAKGYPWFLAKCRDTFAPIGPVVVTSAALNDAFPLDITLTVNGEVRQSGTTAAMVHSIASLIHFLSQATHLKAGDCIATGTPSGVGPLVPGDNVAITISGIGTLSNPVK